MPQARRDHNLARSARTRRGIVASALILWAISATGCYERVVEARGLGTAGMETHQPQRSFLDRLFGPEPKPIDSTPRIRVN